MRFTDDVAPVAGVSIAKAQILPTPTLAHSVACTLIPWDQCCQPKLTVLLTKMPCSSECSGSSLKPRDPNLTNI